MTPSLSYAHKILQQPRPLQRQKALRVKLHAVQRPRPVADTHDLAFRRPAADDEFRIVPGFLANDQAVVAGRLEWVGHAGEHALAIVENRRGFTMHYAVVAHHFAAEDVADALM